MKMRSVMNTDGVLDEKKTKMSNENRGKNSNQRLAKEIF